MLEILNFKIVRNLKGQSFRNNVLGPLHHHSHAK